jgi:hypothetical protein
MAKGMKGPACRTCGNPLHGKNAIDVGYCLSCYNIMMADDDSDFQPCDECDLPDACEDFGCAIKSGVRKDPRIF